MVSCLVAHFKRRRVLGLHFSPIMNAGGRDIVPQPLLDVISPPSLNKWGVHLQIFLFGYNRRTADSG